MKSHVLALASVLTIGVGIPAAALAADMPVRVLPPPPPICDWCGAYIGFNYGGSIGQSSTMDNGVLNSAATGALGIFSETFTHDTRGQLVGGQIGYNWRWSRAWVLGVEVDQQWTNETDTARLFGCGGTSAGFFGAGGPGFNSCLTDQQKLSNFGTARARVGYATGDFLWYWTGGAAWGTVNDNLAFGSTAVVGANPLCAGGVNCGSGGSFSHTMTGWTVGSGVEVKLWSPNWSAKFEYLYVDLGSYIDGVSQPGNAAGSTFAYNTSSHFRDNIVRAGLNYKFW
jgi:outer membrane immunogenic protein